MTVLAIVGSRCLRGNGAAYRAVAEAIDVRPADPLCAPLGVVSGAAVGVDAMAAAAARARGAVDLASAEDLVQLGPGRLWLLELPPLCRRLQRAPGHRCTWRECFQPRDVEIATVCDELVLVRGRCARTYGSGWTRDHASRMGKPTVEVVI